MGTSLLDVKPKDLKFTFELKKQSFCSVQLTNITDNDVAFKVKTTSPNNYCVRPNVGVVPPRTTTKFTITMQAPKVAPPELICKDKFLVQSTIVSPGTEEHDITTNLFSKNGGHYVDEVKLKVTLASPPLSPLPESQDVDETTKFKDNVYKDDKPFVNENPNGVADLDVKPVKKPVEVGGMNAWKKPIEVSDLKAWKNPIELPEMGLKPGKKLKEFTDVEMKPRIKHNEWENEDMKPGKKSNELGEVDMKPGKKSNELGDVDMKPGKKFNELSDVDMKQYINDMNEQNPGNNGTDHNVPSSSSLLRGEVFESDEAVLERTAQSQEREPVETTIGGDMGKIETQLNSLQSKLDLAERAIGKLSEERRISIHEIKVLQDEVAMLKQTRRQRRQSGFPLLFVIMVAMMSTILGYLSHYQR